MNNETARRSDLAEKGLQIRKEVLGADYVNATLAAVDNFNADIQNITNEYCWGNVWAREGLDRRTRSILNLGMLSALNRNHELSVHVRGALTNGVTKEEIKEVLLQVSIYCGLPASLESHRIASAAIREWEQKNGTAA
jgi:4-carboxymuconolactone decarboxylase